MMSVELFAGAGGLAMGVSLAGFKPKAVVEWDRWACDTIRENQQRGFPVVTDWPSPYEGDVRRFDWDSIPENIDLLAGGPPCQPFSLGGKHNANEDNRDMFPATVDVVRRLKPKAFIVENVKGLTRSAFSNYFEYIKLQLEFPEVSPKKSEDWTDHLRRLQKEKTSGRRHATGLTYNVVATLVNAADYGVPQRRERVFIIGFRSDLGIEWNFPKPTHSYDSLIYSQWVSGTYWERHGLHMPKQYMPAKLLAQLRRIGELIEPEGRPWRTVRDALQGLPDVRSPTAKQFANHRFQDGAKIYPGHTGSPLDLPAKTIKAGGHGVPGGENMLVKDDGSVRYFSVRETARVQTFPDGFVFHGSWTETMRQLGNAVPVALAQVIASSVAEKLVLSEMQQLEKQSLGKRLFA